MSKKVFKTSFIISSSKEIFEDSYILIENDRILEITKEVELLFNYFGKQDTPWGFPSAAFAGGIIINKNEFGLTYGGGILGEDVKIEFSAELNPKQEEKEQIED